MEGSKIGWTDHTFNPVRGCQEALLNGATSPACENCYAKAMSERFTSKKPDQENTLGEWGIGTKRYFAKDKYWNEPLRWQAAAKAKGEKHRVFCASLADLFEGAVDQGQEVHSLRADYVPMLERLWKLISNTPDLIWLLLTKRPWNMVSWIEQSGCPENVWCGTTVENQLAAHERIPHLLKIKDTKVRFVSMEPLLEMVLFKPEWVDPYAYFPMGMRCRDERHGEDHQQPVIDWIITGCESLGKRPGRPMEDSWNSTYVAMTRRFNIPFFFKQAVRNGVVVSEPELDGKQYKELPEVEHE